MLRVFTFVLVFLFLGKVGFCFSLFGKGYLVKINGVKYTNEDFKRWWANWKDKNTKLTPSTVQDFINWILLSDEAKALGLDEEPSYKRKVLIFLKVRSLLQLRYDEVGRKIKMDRKRLWKFYQERYTPRVKIKALLTDNETEAKNWISLIKDKNDFEKLYKNLLPKGKARDMGWKRPINTPSDLKKRVFGAQKGDVLGPLKHGKTWLVLFVEDRKEADEEDFRRIHSAVAETYRKYMDSVLTKKLVERLKKKYGVKVNWDVIKGVGLDDLPEDVKDKVVMKVGDVEVTAEQFQKLLKKEADLRLRKKKDKKALETLKKRIVNGIVSQTLIDKEALARHYERGPLKDVYWFYTRNRLIYELETKMIWPKVSVSDEEVKRYYQQHIENFTKPERVELAVIQTQDRELVKVIYERLKKGEDFFDVARDVMFHGATPRRFALKKLVPPVREAVERMKPGEVSNIIKYKNWFFIVKLIKRYSQEVHPFDEVKESIKKTLAKQRFEQLRREYIEKLRRQSTIEINENRWREVLAELGGER